MTLTVKGILSDYLTSIDKDTLGLDKNPNRVKLPDF